MDMDNVDEFLSSEEDEDDDISGLQSRRSDRRADASQNLGASATQRQTTERKVEIAGDRRKSSRKTTPGRRQPRQASDANLNSAASAPAYSHVLELESEAPASATAAPEPAYSHVPVAPPAPAVATPAPVYPYVPAALAPATPAPAVAPAAAVPVFGATMGGSSSWMRDSADSNLRMRMSCMPHNFDDARSILGQVALVANSVCLNYDLGVRMATLCAWEMVSQEKHDLGLQGPHTNVTVIPQLIDRLERLSGSFAIPGCEVFRGCHAARGLVVRSLAAILFCEGVSRAQSAQEVDDHTASFRMTCNAVGHALQADSTIPAPSQDSSTPDPAYGIMSRTANETHDYLLLLSILVKNTPANTAFEDAASRFRHLLSWVQYSRHRFQAMPETSSWFVTSMHRMCLGLSESNIMDQSLS